MVIDPGEGNTASKISAGLVTPYSGKRQAKDGDFERRRQLAKAFYEDVGKQLGTTLWLDESSVRWFQDEQEREDYLSKSMRNEVNDTEGMVDERGETLGYRMLSAARVMVSRFLAGTKEVLRAGRSTDRRSTEDRGNSVSGQGIEIEELKLVAKRIIFCQGFAGRDNPWFPNIQMGQCGARFLRSLCQRRNRMLFSIANIGWRSRWLGVDHRKNIAICGSHLRS